MSDVFVALPPATANGCVIFGKNSDRPPSEVQEVVYVPSAEHAVGSKVKCTFIEVDQVETTHSVVLSRPAWAWGAEMGANDQGVVIGNTSVWTRLNQPGNHDDKLLGVDFVRLGLERAKTAKAALDVITSLLEAHGQGGHCCEELNFGQWTYHNSFLIADRTEAWVLDTAAQVWAARKFTSGVVNISSQLSVGSKMDICSTGLKEKAQSLGLWKPDDGPLDFAKVFGAEFTGLAFSESQKHESRYRIGNELMEDAVKEGPFTQANMFDILRDEESSINFSGELLTMGSQVSLLWPAGSSAPDIHWFTATPNPAVSIFKPFIFHPDATVGTISVSPEHGASFQASVDRRHKLFKAHEKKRELMEGSEPAGTQLVSTLRELEANFIKEIEELLYHFEKGNLHELRDLFKDLAEAEATLYR